MNTLGREGEDIALAFFRKKGYRIVEKNFRTVFGEIDIIARDRDVLVFIEVKTRADDSFGSPFEAVDRRKREKIRKVALCFMKKLKKEVPARFDVLSIESVGADRRIEHIKDAFEV
ncbi:MAG: YraN family protein [Candidatus Sulfobium sp.]|jgi:putative endonuclease